MSDSPFLDHNPGRLHQGTARCEIAYLPVSYAEQDAPPFETINASITAFIATGLQLKYHTDGSYKGMVHIPITEDNQYNDKVLTINMIVDDRQENYWTLHRYMETIMSGETDGFPIRDPRSRIYANDGHYRNRLTWIPYIEISMADDSYQRHQRVRFERCYPLELSDLSLNFLEPEAVTFTMSFIYSLKRIVRSLPPRVNTTPECVVNSGDSSCQC